MKIFAFADEAQPHLQGQIAAMLRNQLQGLEIRTVDGENVSSMSIERIKGINAQLADAGLCIWSLGSPMGKTDIAVDDFAHETDRMKHTVELANAVGCENIRMFSFYLPQGACRSDYTNQVVDRLSVWAEIANEAGVKLCLENEKGLFGEDPGSCRAIYDAISGIWGVFDPANFVQSGIDPLGAWEMLKDRTHYLHIKDAMYDGNVVPAGYGAGQIQTIVREYLKQGGENVTMEPHLHDFGAYKSLEKEGHAVELGKQFAFNSADEAFDAGVAAFRALL